MVDPVTEQEERLREPAALRTPQEVGPRPSTAPGYEELIIERWRNAVRYGGPEAQQRRREHMLYAAIKQGGAVLAIVWAVVMPTGWAYGDAMTNPDLYGKGIVGDPVIEWAHRTRYLWFAVGLIVAPGLWGLALGGPQAVLGTIMIAGFLRMALALHAIAAVNSFGHRYGYQNYKDLDEARNNLFLGYITLGEGWHNNHHAHPRGVSTNARWWEVDMSAWVDFALEKLGLVWNVQRPDMDTQPRQRKPSAPR